MHRLRDVGSKPWSRVRRTCASVAAAAALAHAIGACTSRVGSDAGDATSPIDANTGDVADGDALSSDTDVGSTMSCSELVITSVSAQPGRPERAYPGSQLTLTGRFFEVVDRVSVGGIEQPFVRMGGTLTTTVPPMLASGMQSVTVANALCMTSRTIEISRLVAVFHTGSNAAELLDGTDMTLAGRLVLPSGNVTQAQFTLDGTSMVLRDESGRVSWQALDGRPPVTLSVTSTAPFTIAQGNVVPTDALLVVPGGTSRGVLRLNALDGSTTGYSGGPSNPVSVATPLDGQFALVLDESGGLATLQLPFSRRPTFEPFPTWMPPPAPTEVAIAQGPHSADMHLAAVFDRSSPPTVTALNAIGGVVRDRVTAPGALGRIYFVQGDVVLMDSNTHELLAADITSPATVLWRVPLSGESLTGVVRSEYAVTLYKVGVLTLRTTAGEPSADVVHIVDFQMHPPVERTQARVAGALGIAGAQGAGNPLYVWTTSRVVRLLADAPDAMNFREFAPSGSPPIRRVAVQR